MKKSRRISREAREITQRCNFLHSLLAEFGATLSGFDPGVTANLKGRPAGFAGFPGSGYWGEHLDFSSLEWKWLEPLLVELRQRRQGKAHAR